MFDPQKQHDQLEAYLSRSLGETVRLVHAGRLAKSTREAPWRLEVEAGGERRAYVLRLDSRGIENEYRILHALDGLPVPAPRAYGWDPAGEALGEACFFSDFIEGESLLGPMLRGEAWAEDVYLEAVCALAVVTERDLAGVAVESESAIDILEDAWAFFREQPHPLAERAYLALKTRAPQFPALRFSNGDLWLDNFLVRDGRLAGVIDFANAGFSDPLYEFLLSFFVEPGLRGRGTEARYCRRVGCDPAVLAWYHGLEYFDTWRWVRHSGTPFVQHSDESLQRDLAAWLDRG